MEEDKNQKEIYTKLKWSTNFSQDLLYILGLIFNFFSLRSTKQFWGVVYDAISKQPLDPVIVKLLYTDGREVETTVTDLGGRYGFLAKPGKFKIYVRKTHYTFPSTYVKGDSDGIFENLYHGEFFLLDESSEVVAPNIPMDPEKFDWNQKAKQKLMGSHPYFTIFLKKLTAVLFWFGFLFAILFFWQTFKHSPFYLYAILSLYLVIILLSMTVPEHRLWGQVVLHNFSMPYERLILELTSSMFAGMSFGKANVHEDGRFLLRAGKGRYLLNISYFANNGDKVFLCQLPIKIDNKGVFTSSIHILEK